LFSIIYAFFLLAELFQARMLVGSNNSSQQVNQIDYLSCLPITWRYDMPISEILASLDREIKLLQQARALLAGKSNSSGAAVSAAPLAKRAGKKRRLSPEGRRRIAEAVKRRWERQRKAAAAAAKK